MICRRCGREIPRYLLGRESFECPECGYRYYKRPSPQGRTASQNRPVQQHRPAQRYERQARRPAPASATGMPMRLPRMIIGILSDVMFIIVMFQSCATNVVNSLGSNTTDTSAGGGTILAFALLIAGVTGAIGRDSLKATLTAAVIYLVGALIGFVSLGTFSDLIVWSVVALIFGALNAFCWWKGKNAR